MPSIIKKTSSFGDGCLFQVLGMFLLVVALVTYRTGFGPYLFGGLAFFAFVYGIKRARWYECSSCNTRIGKRSKVCPSCNGVLR